MADTAPPATHPVTSAGSLPSQEAGEAVNGVKATPEQRATTEAPSAETGLPQFRFEYWAGQIVWLVVLFALLYTLLARVFVPRLRKVKDDRDTAINGAVEEARRVRAEADAQAAASHAEMSEARAKAGAAASDAKARAAAEAQARQRAQDVELNARLAEAEARIAASRDAAMGSVREVAADTAAAIVERLTGRPAEAGEVDAALTARG